MQHYAVGSASHDGRVGAALAAELQISFHHGSRDLIFEEARLHPLPGRAMGRDGRVGRLADQCDLGRRFPQPKARDRIRRVAPVMQWSQSREIAGLRVAAQRVDRVRRLHGFHKLRFELSPRQHFIEPGFLRGVFFVGAGSPAVVSLAIRHARRQEQDLVFGSQQQRGAGLVPACEVFKIRLLIKGIVQIGRVRRAHEHQRSVQRFAEVRAPLTVFRRRNRLRPDRRQRRQAQDQQARHADHKQ